MIMSVLGIVCHLILYFPVNQGLAINLPWPTRKNKKRFELFEVFDIISYRVFFLLSFFFVADLHVQIIIPPHPTSRLYLIIGPLHCQEIIKPFCHKMK